MPQYDSLRLKQNNFDLLRFVFASTVALVHASDLSGFQQLAFLPNNLSTDIAVEAFFVLSGFLIFRSFERSNSLSAYADKRIRRIYPAYFSVVVFCALSLVLLSAQNIADFFSIAWVKYLLANLSFLNFLQPSLPGVFADNKLEVVNGALWTLKIEVMFYLTVPFFVFLFRRFTCFKVLLCVYCLSVLYTVLCSALALRTGAEIYNQLGRQLPGQLSYFMAGAFLYYFLEVFERRVIRFVLVAVGVLVISRFYSLPLLEPLAIAIVVIFFSLFLCLGNFGKYGDFSYGVYITHFPIIQCLLALGWFQTQAWAFLLTVIALTLVTAVAMWHLVEKRFLASSNHYIETTVETAKGY